MSMLSAQTKRLREAADDLDFYTITRDIHTASMLMRDAADTIDELRARCQELQEREWQTCRNVAKQPSNGGFWPLPHFECSECKAFYIASSYVHYCPSCGKKVAV